MSNFMNILPVGAELLQAKRRTDGRTDARKDMTKLIMAFRNFVNSRENFRSLSEEDVL